ncbi:anaphase-promoting complex subunit 1-like isoform X2 [Apostichopus japonicus]|uniref:anaphase-promoting complex subunit 1-like isoform X2 n=1 Tax=Stichopus japonicus TaxID=307972 RepID=UPI003AB2A581
MTEQRENFEPIKSRGKCGQPPTSTPHVFGFDISDTLKLEGKSEELDMIAASSPEEFIPLGRSTYNQHPGKHLFSGNNYCRDNASTTHQRHCLTEEHWSVRKTSGVRSDGSNHEEELYYKDRTVIWSRGHSATASRLQKTITTEHPILQASFVKFSSEVVNTSDGKVSHNQEIQVPSICIVHDIGLTVIADSGEEYYCSLPFMVKNVWPIDGKLLIERALTKKDISGSASQAKELPTLFSLKHPLDEPSPMLAKTGGSGKLQFMQDAAQNVIFSNTDPDIVVTFDLSLGLHLVWSLRQTKSDEINTAMKLLDSTAGSALLPSFVATPRGTQSSGTLAGLSSSAQSRLSASSISSAAFSPASFRHQYTSSRAASPMTTSRPHTPAASAVKNISQSSLGGHVTPAYCKSRSSLGTAYSPVMSILATPCADINEPLTPDLCLELGWTESSGRGEGVLSRASKVFITRDLCEQKYLCFLVRQHQQLRCLKFSASNDKSQLIFGSVTNVPALDAEPLDTMNMLIVLDTSSSLVLYTGLVKISRILVPGIHQVLSNRIVAPGLPRPSTPLDSHILTGTPSSSNFVHTQDDQVMLLSPVGVDLSVNMDSSILSDDLSFSSPGMGRTIKSLRDALGDQFTLVCSGGTLLRTSIPPFTTSPVVKLCLDALKKNLPREVAMQLATKWYTTHNAPGNSDGGTEWLKFAGCVLQMMGYNVNQLEMFRQGVSSSSSPTVTVKKHKPSGCDEDWEYLLGSCYHQQVAEDLPNSSSSRSKLKVKEQEVEVAQEEVNPAIDSSAPLFHHITSVAFVLHLVYEETKLHRLHHKSSEQVASLACQLAKDVGWSEYVEHYCRLHPHLVSIMEQEHSQLKPDQRVLLPEPSGYSTLPPCFNRWLYNSILGNPQDPFPHMDFICKKTHQLIAIYSLYFNKIPSSVQFVDTLFRRLSIAASSLYTESTSHLVGFVNKTTKFTPAERTVLYMSEIGWTVGDISALPFSLSLPLYEALAVVRENPPSGWPESAYALLVRKDLSKQSDWLQRSKGCLKEISTQSKSDSKGKPADTDGMEGLDNDLLKFRFPDDLRITEVKKLLQSARPVVIALTQKPEVSDHEFLEQQEMRLLLVSQRTMALPLARGMLTMHTCRSSITEPVPIPKLNLSGRAPPRNTNIAFQHIDVPDNVRDWPWFHNGVAAGLQLGPNDSKIDSAWIVYNQPEGKNLTNEFGGFLMALGLTGHLTKLFRMVLHKYLCSSHEMTGIGLALGLAAAKKGTMDVAVTKILSLHISALLPPTSTELAVPHNLQVAAILGIGLVYQGTAHRHMAEVLLGEIGRPPGPELENCADRESYSLAAGLALGMVLLKHGSDAVGLSDLELANQLYLYMAGGHKRPSSHYNSLDTGKSPCYQIQEGDQVNVDVTSPGATLALGLMFLQTGNKAVAQWLAVPETPYLLEFVKPDFLLLRTLSRGLVLWDDIRPTEDWIKSNIPKVVQKYALRKMTAQEEGEEEIDAQTMSQSSCCIIAGACMALGLRFAGTANNAAFLCLLKFAEQFVQLGSQSVAELAGKATIEKCLNTVGVSLAMVMAGTGNLKVLRLARALRSRVSDDVTYGNHMAISSMIGLLFLGGGRFTLSNSAEAVAALICSFYPVFPNNSKDNRYHLQAFRHLYVLASEPRLVLPKEVSSGDMCYVPLEITFKKTIWHEEHCVQMLAPCIIPELSQIKELRIIGPRYMPITLRPESDLQLLKQILRLGGVLFVKQRAGHLSYAEDPKGYKGLLAQSFTHDTTGSHLTDPKLIHAFTSDPRVLNFSKMFCHFKADGRKDAELLLSPLMFECVIQEKINILPVLLEIYATLERLRRDLSPIDLWQLKLVLSFASKCSEAACLNGRSGIKAQLISSETCQLLQAEVEGILIKCLQENKELVQRYLIQGKQPHTKEDFAKLACFLNYFHLPSAARISALQVTDEPSMGQLLLTARTLRVPTIVVRTLKVTLKQDR